MQCLCLACPGSSGCEPCCELAGGGETPVPALPSHQPAAWPHSGCSPYLPGQRVDGTEFQESGNVEYFSFSVLTLSYFALDSL